MIPPADTWKGVVALVWNPLHGCHKFSEGCEHCYVYRRDLQVGRDPSHIYKTSAFSLPLQKKRNGTYKVPPGSVIFTCMTSDFFMEEADLHRPELWNMIRLRPDIRFVIITKRIHRFYKCIPNNWKDGYSNVVICCTIENQKRCAERLPIFQTLPIVQKTIICEPLLSPIDLSPYLGPEISLVSVGGESGPQARTCRYEWILDIRDQCLRHGVPFVFRQTGAHFYKDGKWYSIPRKDQIAQARKAALDTLQPDREFLHYDDA